MDENYPGKGLFHDDNNYGVSLSVYHAQILAVSQSSDNFDGQKPVLLSILMNRKQLQQIIDNQQLFDNSVVNSARLLVRFYEDLEIRG